MTNEARVVGRLWHGRTAVANSDRYQEHLRRATFPGLTELDGFRGAYVLRRIADEAAEFVVLTFWDSEGAIEAFAGSDRERAVVPPEAAELLEHWDERATHYEVVLRRTADLP
jgi:heme-degrading monooxygenase HmoA